MNELSENNKSSKNFKKNISILVSFGISALALFVLLTNEELSFSKIIEKMTSARIDFICVAVALLLIHIYFRAIRWHNLLMPVKIISINSLFKVMMIGLMANNILPARLGELMRCWVLGQKENISMLPIIASVVVERIFDGIAIAGLLVIILLCYPLPWLNGKVGPYGESAIFIIGITMLSVFIALLSMVVLLRVNPLFCEKMLNKIMKILPSAISSKILKFYKSFTEGLKLTNLWGLLKLVFYSIVIWIIQGVCAWTILAAMGINELNLIEALFVVIVISIMIMIPSAPAYIGTFQLAGTASLIFLGITTHLAAGFSWIFWLIGFLPVTLIGVFFLWHENISLRNIKSEALQFGQKI